MTPLAFLESDEGPLRFAHLGERLFRGGQPTRHHLEALKALGVGTVINLRREKRKVWQEERQHCLELGLEFCRFPFYGVFGASDELIERILTAMCKGGVYIHCKHGRDRTSLLVALYRVHFEGWDPERAWRDEVLRYEHQPTYFYRRVRHVFERFAARPPMCVTA